MIRAVIAVVWSVALGPVGQAAAAENVAVFAVEATAADALTATTPGRLPATMARIRSGEPVKIVCWGDSLTAKKHGVALADAAARWEHLAKEGECS